MLAPSVDTCFQEYPYKLSVPRLCCQCWCGLLRRCTGSYIQIRVWSGHSSRPFTVKLCNDTRGCWRDSAAESARTVHVRCGFELCWMDVVLLCSDLRRRAVSRTRRTSGCPRRSHVALCMRLALLAPVTVCLQPASRYTVGCTYNSAYICSVSSAVRAPHVAAETVRTSGEPAATYSEAHRRARGVADAATACPNISAR